MGDERRRKSRLRAGHVGSCEAMRKNGIFGKDDVCFLVSVCFACAFFCVMIETLDAELIKLLELFSKLFLKPFL